MLERRKVRPRVRGHRPGNSCPAGQVESARSFFASFFAKSTWIPQLNAAPGSELEVIVLKWAVIFFVIAIIAAILGFGGIAAGAAEIAKILFFVFLIVFVVTLIVSMKRK